VACAVDLSTPRRVADTVLIAKFILSGLTGVVLAQIQNLIFELQRSRYQIFAVFSPMSLQFKSVKNSVHRILDKVGVGGRLGVIEAHQPKRGVCSSAENTDTKKMSAQLCFGALPRRAPCLIDGRNARVYRGLQ
jgi:hypothetical protein